MSASPSREPTPAVVAVLPGSLPALLATSLPLFCPVVAPSYLAIERPCPRLRRRWSDPKPDPQPSSGP